MYLLHTKLLKYNTDWTFLDQVDYNILLTLYRPQKSEMNAWNLMPVLKERKGFRNYYQASTVSVVEAGGHVGKKKLLMCWIRL